MVAMGVLHGRGEATPDQHVCSFMPAPTTMLQVLILVERSLGSTKEAAEYTVGDQYGFQGLECVAMVTGLPLRGRKQQLSGYVFQRRSPQSSPAGPSQPSNSSPAGSVAPATPPQLMVQQLQLGGLPLEAASLGWACSLSNSPAQPSSCSASPMQASSSSWLEQQQNVAVPPEHLLDTLAVLRAPQRQPAALGGKRKSATAGSSPSRKRRKQGQRPTGREWLQWVKDVAAEHVRPPGVGCTFPRGKQEIGGFDLWAWAANTSSCIMLAPRTRNGQGYGQLYLGEEEGSSRGSRGVKEYVHRLVCWAQHGPPAEDRGYAGHLCGQAACVNPHHLLWISPQENSDAAKWHQQHGVGELWTPATPPQPAPSQPLLPSLHTSPGSPATPQLSVRRQLHLGHSDASTHQPSTSPPSSFFGGWCSCSALPPAAAPAAGLT